MTIQKRIITLIMCLALVICMGGGLWLSAFAVNASAEVASYSSPIEDLSASENFNVADYPEISTDYSLEIIALSESVDNELYVYVYQPSATTKFLKATSITIDAPLNNEERNFRIYSLSLLGSQGVFHKYRVESLTLRDTPIRKYSVSEIFRAFDSTIDESPGNGNTISEKAYAVGKMWTLSDENDGITTSVVYEDVIEVTEKHVGHVRYNNNSVGGTLLGFSEDYRSHYVAFSTDRPIDQIIEVDMYYKYENVDILPTSDRLATQAYRSSGTKYLTLNSEQVLEINTTGIFQDVYKYKRIQSVDAFFEMEEQDIENTDVLKDKEWILRFTETSYTDNIWMSGNYYNGSFSCTNIKDVALLRIEYEYGGVVYNLGVVDDMQTGSNSPDGTHGYFEYEEQWQIIMYALMFISVVVIIIFTIVVFKPFFNLLWLGIKTLFALVINIILFPFKLIGSLFKPRK